MAINESGFLTSESFLSTITHEELSRLSPSALLKGASDKIAFLERNHEYFFGNYSNEIEGYSSGDTLLAQHAATSNVESFFSGSNKARETSTGSSTEMRAFSTLWTPKVAESVAQSLVHARTLLESGIVNEDDIASIINLAKIILASPAFAITRQDNKNYCHASYEVKEARLAYLESAMPEVQSRIIDVTVGSIYGKSSQEAIRTLKNNIAHLQAHENIFNFPEAPFEVLTSSAKILLCGIERNEVP